eukprot:TRINITY_DN3126_c0_g1_i1.p1 TRINITY_DN3126_c0_g1~~TRINITY_DN3126_c0_g1_i1.p1  ORF type:complete len:441 (-),score=101.32 TRINITY_DN3126_c0_g1_i1:94-1416(-)
MGDSDDESTAVILDLGAYATRFGEAGDDVPSVEFANETHATLSDRISKVVATSNKALKDVVLSLPVLASTPAVEMVKTLFDKFGVSSVMGATSSMLSLLSQDKDTGLVVDVGAESSVFPILYGLGLQEGLLRDSIGGRQVTERLRDLLKQNGIVVSETEADQIKRNAKPSQPSVSFKKDNGSEDSVQIQYKWVEDAIDALLGNKDTGLVSLLAKSLQRLEADARGELISKIYIVGGGAAFEGLAAKIEARLSELLKTKKVKVINASDVAEWRLFPWKGASILGSLSSLRSQYITKQEYLKHKDDAQLAALLHQKWNTFPKASDKTKESEKVHLVYKFSKDYEAMCPYSSLSPNFPSELGCSFTGTPSQIESHLARDHPPHQPTRQVLPVFGGDAGDGGDDDGGLVFEEVKTVNRVSQVEQDFDEEEAEEELVFFDVVRRG